MNNTIVSTEHGPYVSDAEAAIATKYGATDTSFAGPGDDEGAQIQLTIDFPESDSCDGYALGQVDVTKPYETGGKWHADPVFDPHASMSAEETRAVAAKLLIAADMLDDLNGEPRQQDGIDWRKLADERMREAQATACGVEGCEGEGHDYLEDPDKWIHQVGHEEFDNGCVKVDLYYTNADGYYADVNLHGQEAMTASRIRGEADTYSRYPEMLASIAQRLDELNAVGA